MGKAVAKLADPMSCGDVIAQGSGNVSVNGIPCARKGDKTAGHCYKPTPIRSNSRTVFVNNKPIGRLGDRIRHRCSRKKKSHNAKVAGASSDVFAG